MSLIVVAIITLSAILIPAFWPYSYDQQLGVRPGKPVDASFNNLAPFEYGKTELKRIEEGEKVFPHVFGTDSAGRDYFIRVVYGTRISLAVGFFASLIVSAPSQATAAARSTSSSCASSISSTPCPIR